MSNLSELKQYRSSTVDSPLSVYGEYCIVDGLETSILPKIEESDVVKAIIKPGTFILNGKLFKLEEELTLDLDVSLYDESGEIILILTYCFCSSKGSYYYFRLGYLPHNKKNIFPALPSSILDQTCSEDCTSMVLNIVKFKHGSIATQTQPLIPVEIITIIPITIKITQLIIHSFLFFISQIF